MADDYKPFILKRGASLNDQEYREEFEAIEARATKEGRTSSEIFRIALFRRNFEKMGKGEFYDEKLVESRKNGEPYMDFIKRMKRTYLAH